MRVCQNPECAANFSPNAHNQKYCTEECCNEVTNNRIKKKYYRDKAIKEGLKRNCAHRGCDIILSRYNLEDECSGCRQQGELMPADILRFLT
jgi:hypothetical protein